MSFPILGLFWLHLGRWFDAKGLPSVANACWRHGIASRGGLAAEAGFQLGKRLLEQDKNRDAVAVLEVAVARDPGNARAWCALGAARRRLADMAGARAATDEALRLAPAYPQARCNLGEWYLTKGEVALALPCFDEALRLDPALLEALNNRVAALYELGRFDAALAAAEAAIESYPEVAALRVNLGNVLLHTGRDKPAAKTFQKALELDPTCPEAHLGLATLYGETQHLALALQFIEQEIELKGESSQRLASLALAQQTKGDNPAAETTCLKLLEIQPGNISALVTLAGCLSIRGDHEGAIECCEKALALNPAMPAIASNVAFNSTYLADASPDSVFAAHRAWAERFEAPLAEKCYRHSPRGNPDKRLRLGYVSGDFGMHPVGFLVRDVLGHHDRGNFEIHAFSMMRKDTDPVTAQIRGLCDAWHDILLDTDEEVARKIHDLNIDILVDLSGHTAYNRLPSFVLRPAPVSATWIGYFHSTGLDGIDYFITDPHTSPSGCGQRFSEIPVYLPHSRFCYSPPDYAPSPIPPPVLDRGYVTFGCFNRLEKLVDPVLAVWARILRAVPGSRLLLKAGSLDNETMSRQVRDRFAAHGIDGSRLDLRGRSDHADMFAEYGDVDIALDPFPFNGGMTTLEALWMGVPVITWAGQGIVSRQTYSVLANIGLTELAFPDTEAYVAGAVSLAGNRDRLAVIRGQLRQRMTESPVCQPARFTRDVESLYRRMWRAWCEGRRLPDELAAQEGEAR